MLREEGLQRVRECPGWSLIWKERVRVDQASAIHGNAQSTEESEDFRVNSDQAVEATKDEAGKGIRSGGFRFGRRRVAAGMKRHHRSAAALEGADQAQSEKSAAQESSQVQM